MLASLEFAFNSLLRLVYPSFCHECSYLIPQDTVLCHSCATQIPRITSTLLPYSGKNFITVHALAPYDGILRKLILQKNSGRWRQFKGLARLVHTYGNKTHQGADCFIPVPLHWTRTLWRGYNQAHTLSREYAALTGAQVFDCLKRSRKTPFQSQHAKDGREENVKNAFAIQERHIKNMSHMITGKHIVLVDDVMTTGATLKEVARLISHYKPAKITGLVVCRVV